MTTSITTIVPPSFAELARSLRELEETTDEDLAQAGRLLVAAVDSRRIAGMSAPAAQPIFDSIAKVMAHRFEGRKELCHVHSRMRTVGKAVLPELAWGPDEKCPVSGTADIEAPAGVALRAA